MRLVDLLPAMGVGPADGDGDGAAGPLIDLAAEPVTGFAIDHRKVAPGTIFGAFRGQVANGEDYIPQAFAAGALATVSTAGITFRDGTTLPIDDSPRQIFAGLAAQFFVPFPPVTVAVTGTNGKTSIVELTRQLWRFAGHSAASVGTLGVTTNEEQVRTGLTTPDIITFLANMGGLAREGVTHVAFEASSHGLHQYRVDGVPLQAAAFTNLSRDHLDYHGDMAAYLTAKLRLFSELIDANGTAVVWQDESEAADRVIDLARARGLKLIGVGRNGATLRLIDVTASRFGQQLTVLHDGQTHSVALPLIGEYQVANALTAAGLVIATGGDVAQTLANLARLQPVRGRLERALITRVGAPVYVDYAHTPDALSAAIAALRPHTRGRLILVFGAGGERDTGKRPEMGTVAADKADIVIVTDDNPRGEDPAEIRRAILAKAPMGIEIGDRREAIARAVTIAGPDDVVLIAGKGHESGQEIGSGATRLIIPFDDVTVAREVAS